MKYIMMLILFGFVLFGFAQQKRWDLQDELMELYDLSRLPSYHTGTIPGEETTYDRKGGNDDDGFSGIYSFVCRNENSSLVMLDIDGPGVLNRFATPTPTSDTLDFYIDNNDKPALSICYLDLFSGKVYPFIMPLCSSAVGGYYCYYPFVFQKHLRIVCRGRHLQFHQLQYRLFPKETPIQSFSLPNTIAETDAIRQVVINWRDIGAVAKGNSIKKSVRLGAKQKQIVFRLKEGGRINGIKIDSAGSTDLILKITWDGEKQPAIKGKVGDLFGVAFGKPAMQGLLVGQRDGQYYCYFPMPFNTRAKIELINHGNANFEGTMEIIYSNEKRVPSEGKLYASVINNRLGPENPYHVFLAIKGEGHYVGTILYAQGLMANGHGTPFLEGDDTTATDGMSRMHGTGTEDYFNGGWYDIKGRWDHPESTALSGCLGYSSKESYSGAYRFFMTDKISFENQFYHAIEHGASVRGLPVQYKSVAWYYCDRGKEQQVNKNKIIK